MPASSQEWGPSAAPTALSTGTRLNKPADLESLQVAPDQGCPGCDAMERPNTMTSAKPVAPYLGGKRNLAKRICKIIDADDHHTYAEPFVGMGGIFLRRAQPAKSEFINDLNGDIYNLFRVLQEHYVAFLDLLRFQITTQANFNRLVSVDPATLTDLQRAARFLYLQRCAFGGKVSGRNFGISTGRSSRFNITTLEPDLEALHERLAGVTVTNMDFAAFLDRIDRMGAFFYLDPPYWGSESDYGRDAFSRARFSEMADQLRALSGKWLLSINDTPEVRTLFAGCEIREVTTTYGVSKGAAQSGVREFLIANFDLPDPPKHT